MWVVLVGVGNNRFRMATDDSFKNRDAAMSWIAKQVSGSYYVAELVTIF